MIPKSVKTVEQWAFMDCEKLESITIENANTRIDWTAITGRRDKKTIVINAPVVSTAKELCLKYGKKNNLIFKPLAAGFFKKLFKK